MDRSDTQLIAAVAAGDREALAEIYRSLKDDLFTIGWHLMRDRASAEDAVHDAICGFVRSAGKLRLRGTLRDYLVRSVVNRTRDFARRPRPQAVAEELLPNTGAPVEDALLVTEALAALPEAQREVCVLRTFGRLGFREIAELQSASINTVQSRYRYALSSLRQQLKKEGVEE